MEEEIRQHMAALGSGQLQGGELSLWLCIYLSVVPLLICDLEIINIVQSHTTGDLEKIHIGVFKLAYLFSRVKK